MRILFWGTPDYAVPSLSALVGEDHEVVGVVTQPDRPAGRGRELREPPVKTIARDENIEVFQPEKARDPGFIAAIRELKPEISVVVAYGQILSREVLELPTYGSINAHASLLPELRGAAPINWAIVRGDTRTGVTVMRMVEKMDAGPILHQVEEPINADDTASDLWQRLSEISAESLVETLALIESGDVSEVAQDDDKATFAPRILREHAHINFSHGATIVANMIRGMDDMPGAWASAEDTEFKLYRPVARADESHDAKPGTILGISTTDPTEGMVIACGIGTVAVREIKPQGKRRMTVAEWARGRGLPVGSMMG